jgi:hypothetical protein
MPFLIYLLLTQEIIMRSLSFLLFFPFFIFSSFLEGHSLLDEFAKAQTGDFVVFSKQKHYIVFHFAEVSEQKLTLEEITVLEDSFQKKSVNFKEWIANKAPNYSSWNLFILDRKTGALEASYTLKDTSWVHNVASFPFLPQLLTLSLEKVPLVAQKKVGVPPQEGFEDLRKPWRPKFIVDGKPIDGGFEVDVYKTRYKESGALSDKVIYLYFPRSQKALSYFPYWIEVMQIVGKETLPVVDSGKGMKSPISPKL